MEIAEEYKAGMANESILPVYIGDWHWNGGGVNLRLSTTRKPSIWNRFWISFFFGAEWLAKR